MAAKAAKDASNEPGSKNTPRQPSEFDKKFNSLKERNMKQKEKEPVVITVQKSELTSALKVSIGESSKSLADRLLDGEEDSKKQAPVKILPPGSTIRRGTSAEHLSGSASTDKNMFNILREEDTPSLALSVKPSVLSGLVKSSSTS